MDLARMEIRTDQSVQAVPSDASTDSERALQDLQRTFDQRLQERTRELNQTIHHLQQEIMRHQATEALLAARELRYRLLYEQNPSMYFTLDPSGRILSVNQFGATALGYRPGELIDRSVLCVFHPDDHQTVLTQLHLCASSPETTFDWEIQKIRKDGSQLWVKERARQVTDPHGHPMILVVCEDMTDRREAEATLRKSEERFRQIAETIEEVVWSADPSIGKMLYISPAYERIWGRSCASLYAEPKSFIEAIHPDDRPRVVKELIAQQEGRLFAHEYRVLRPDGTIRWVWDRGFPVVDQATGLLTHYVGVALDITERKQAEEALRESQTRLAFVLSHSPAVIYTAAASGEFGATFVSANITAQLGYEPQEFTNDPRFWVDRIHPDDAPEIFKRLSALFAQGTLAHEYRFLNKQGQYRWMHDEVVLIRDPDGHPVELLGSWLDITERKQTEELLRVSEERFAKAFRSSPHPVIVTERETGLCLEVNDAGLALFGYRREEVIGQTVPTLRLWATPEDRAQFFARLAQAGTFRNVEMEFYTKDRTPRQCLVSCEPIEIDGKACLVTVGTDITEQKRAEEAVRLQERILQQAREERERISQDLHDNILQSLYAVGMQLEASKLVAGTSARKSKTHVTQAIAQLNQLVQEVRHFIALLHQRNAPNMDFERTLRQLADSFSSAGHNAPTLTIQPEAIPLITATMGEQLVSIAREALSNSMRHAKASTRSMTLRFIGSIIQLRITDDGIGFKPGQKRRRGQGLRNMATRAAHIGARFLLASTPGQGTSVIVEVPLERPHEPGTI
ncbi:MAG: PAS domain S-box protein [Nitrospira sp.]|nr:PAS domain S-box protein [Nitrospira sp.]